MSEEKRQEPHCGKEFRQFRDSDPSIGSQPLEDRALKEAARLFGEELMPLLGIEGKIRRVAPTEQVYLKPKDYLQDFNYEMMDGRWIHLEFESDSIRTADLRRFRTYEAIMSQHYKAEVTTYVVCSSEVKVLRDHLTEGINTYRVIPVRLKDRNADEVIRKLEIRQKEGQLDRPDLLELLLTPLMDGEMFQKERIQRGIHLLRGEWERRNQEELAQMEAVLYTFAMKFLAPQDLKEIKEMMNMTILGEMIFQDGIEKGIDQVNRLTQVLMETNRLEDLRRAAKDREYQRQLVEELFPGEYVPAPKKTLWS